MSPVITRLRKFYATYLPLGDLLGEIFYAVWMVVVSLGILGGTGFEGGELAYVIFIAFVVNITWGLIDGLSAMYSGVIERSQSEMIIYSLQSKNDAGARKEGNRALSEGITSVLDSSDREKVLDMIASTRPIGRDPSSTRHLPQRNDWRYALGILSIDVLLVLPLVAPFLIFQDSHLALYVSRLIATAFFAILGAAYARQLNRRRWLAALFLATLCFTLFNLVFLLGW